MVLLDEQLAVVSELHAARAKRSPCAMEMNPTCSEHSGTVNDSLNDGAYKPQSKT